MKSLDTAIERSVDAFVPPMSESYTKMIDDTVSQLRKTSGQGSLPVRRAWKPLAAAAAVIAAVIIFSTTVFGMRPALAAEVPFVSGIVYAAAPQRAASDATRDGIEALLSNAMHSLAICDYDAASACFREGAMLARDNYLAAAYLNRLLTFGDYFPEDADAAELELSDLQAEQKAFRYTAHLTLSLVSRDGKRTDSEVCTARIWENTEGLHIERIEFESPRYEAYVSAYEAAFGAVPAGGSSFGLIPIDNLCLGAAHADDASTVSPRREAARINHLLSELDYVPASQDEKALRANMLLSELEKTNALITPAMVSAEEAASELMYRYWLGAKTGDVCDFDDIIERNADTDLFLWDALLKADHVRLGVLRPLTIVEPDNAEIQEIIEDADGLLKARFYVHTEISDGIMQGVGEEIVLTLRRGANGFTIVGFDRETGDGLYIYSLKPLASKYKAKGYSWQEAGRMAYDELYAEAERNAEWLENY